jgi:hypothetical protein
MEKKINYVDYYKYLMKNKHGKKNVLMELNIHILYQIFSFYGIQRLINRKVLKNRKVLQCLTTYNMY